MEWHDYMTSVKEQIRNKKAKELIEEELSDHFEEQTKAYEQEGLTPADAKDKAMESMGDSVEIGMMFDRVHRPKTDIKLLIIISCISIFSLIVQYFAGNSILKENYFRNEVLYMILGIALMIGIYFIDYTLIGKYPLVLWTILCAISLYEAFLGRRHYSININILFLSYVFLPLFSGLIFYFRKYKTKGLILCGALGFLPIFFCFAGNCISGAFHYSVVAFLMVLIAVIKGWFGKPVKRNLLITLGGTVLVVILIGIFTRYFWFSGYQQARFDAIFHNDTTFELFYQSNQALGVLKNSQLIGAGASDVSSIPAVESNYILVYIFATFGILVGILVIVGFVFLLLRALHIVKKQRSYLGYMISLSCFLLLSEQFVIYVITNFFHTKLDILISQLYLPFLSGGGRNLLCSFFTIGLLLSVFRNTELVKNS